MKSTNYSVKGAFSAAFTATARRQLPGALIAAAVSAIVSVIYALFYCTGYYGYDNDISYGVMMWGSAVLFIAAVYSAISVGVMFNAYFSRRACDYHFAMPFKRSHLYHANFLFGLTAIALLIAVSVAVFSATAGIISAANPEGKVTYIILTAEVLKPLLTLLASLLAGYSACTMCAAVSGKWLQYAVLVFICIFSVPVLLIGVASRINSIWGVMVSLFDFASITPVGVAAMLLISTFDYHSFHKLAIVIFGVSLFLLVFLLICRYAHIESIANWEGDATRWLNFGFVSFQPSEIAKFALIVLFAHMISRNLDRMDTFRYGVVPYVAIMGLVAALIFLESHLSATLIILALGAIMMFVGGTKPRWFLIGGVLVAAVLLFVVVTKGGYQMDRIRIWLDPFSSDLDRDLTHQTRQSLYAIGSGGLLGVGLGQSRQKYLYLPAPQNDFIFAIVCEELGFVGALVIIVLFALLIWRGVYVSIHARDKFGMLLGLGITFQVGLQAVLNICVVTNTIPNTGISLPFFSYGGTALLMLLGQMGILLNISRSANVEKT